MQQFEGKLSECLAFSQPTFTSGIKDTESLLPEERDPNLNLLEDCIWRLPMIGTNQISAKFTTYVDWTMV